MRTWPVRVAILATMALGTASASATAQQAALPLTRPERTGFTETSRHADVLAFLDSLEAAGARMERGTFGTTTNGLPLPYVVASRPLVRTPAEARASGRPVVFVQGNIHGGEVEGKEALQILLRELLTDSAPNVLDSIVLLALPIYNADGNESWGDQERNRGSQNGPKVIGQRPNAQGLDLNRDYIKAESPEARASLAFLNAWDPHVMVDLHATNGSYHGYELTYSPSLYPAAPAGQWTRANILPELRRRFRDRHGMEAIDYGNFGPGFGRDDPTSPEKGGWYTYEHVPRFGTNYYALRNRLSVLSEAYSHDPFHHRVASTRAFVTELLSLVAERAPEILRVTAELDTESAALAMRDSVAIRGRMTSTPHRDTILVELLESTGDTVRTAPGVRAGFRRTGRVVPVEMDVYDSFDPAAWSVVPAAFALAGPDSSAIELLRRHGIELRQLSAEWRGEARVFLPDSIGVAPRPFQGHSMILPLEGSWEARSITLPAGSWIVPGAQRLARLATVLLHPQSDDGLTTWNHFDAVLEPGKPHPVVLLYELPGAGG